jgi:hypothetical protein
MKTLKTILTAILYLIAGMGSGVSAQRSDSDNVKPPVFGFGFKVAQFSISDLFENVMPGNKFLMTITPHKNFRIEGSFAFMSQKHESQTGTELPAKSMFYGVSAFGMWQKGHTNFYGGLRLGFLRHRQLNEYWDYDPNTYENYSYTLEAEGKSNTVGGVVGVEYFFSRHFTIGGEISLNSISSEYKDPGMRNSSNDSKSKALMTETGLVMRLYF